MYRVSFHPEQCALSVFFLSCFASLFIAFPAFLCVSPAFPGSRPRESYFSYVSIIVHSSVSLGNMLLISLCAFICLFLSRFFQFHALKSRLLSLNTPTVKRMRRIDTDCSACMFFCSLQIGTGRFSHVKYRWYAYAPAIKNSGNAPYVVHSVLHRQAPLDGFMIYQCAMLKFPVRKKGIFRSLSSISVMSHSARSRSQGHSLQDGVHVHRILRGHEETADGK